MTNSVSLLFAVCRIFLSSFTVRNILRFSRDRSNSSSPPCSSTRSQNLPGIYLLSKVSKFWHHTELCCNFWLLVWCVLLRCFELRHRVVWCVATSVSEHHNASFWIEQGGRRCCPGPHFVITEETTGWIFAALNASDLLQPNILYLHDLSAPSEVHSSAETLFDVGLV